MSQKKKGSLDASGLPQHAGHIFAGVIVGLMLEPLPGAAIGLIGVSVVTLRVSYSE